MQTITITVCANVESLGITYSADIPDILVVADYQAYAQANASKLSYHKAKSTARTEAKKAILDTVESKYGKETASTGVILSGFPLLIMRFSKALV
jgi:hypothetical protein